jgi:hypothetical protein
VNKQIYKLTRSSSTDYWLGRELTIPHHKKQHVTKCYIEKITYENGASSNTLVVMTVTNQN